jgi:hypothetical protein
VRGHALLGVLAAVNAYDCDSVAIPLLELPQLRKYMDAVHSPIGPEIEKEELSSKVRQ